MGPYTEDRFIWAAHVALETAIQTFSDQETVMFVQHWPDGLPPCGQNSTRTPGEILSYPRFGSGGRENELGALTWSSAFSQLKAGRTLSTLPASALGRANGGPVLAFDSRRGFRSIVVSPFDNFLATSQSMSRLASPWHCPPTNGCSVVKPNTDVTGNPKVDLGHISHS